MNTLKPLIIISVMAFTFSPAKSQYRGGSDLSVGGGAEVRLLTSQFYYGGKFSWTYSLGSGALRGNLGFGPYIEQQYASYSSKNYSGSQLTSSYSAKGFRKGKAANVMLAYQLNLGQARRSQGGFNISFGLNYQLAWMKIINRGSEDALDAFDLPQEKKGTVNELYVELASGYVFSEVGSGELFVDLRSGIGILGMGRFFEQASEAAQSGPGGQNEENDLSEDLITPATYVGPTVGYRF